MWSEGIVAAGPLMQSGTNRGKVKYPAVPRPELLPTGAIESLDTTVERGTSRRQHIERNAQIAAGRFKLRYDLATPNPPEWPSRGMAGCRSGHGGDLVPFAQMLTCAHPSPPGALRHQWPRTDAAPPRAWDAGGRCRSGSDRQERREQPLSGTTHGKGPGNHPCHTKPTAIVRLDDEVSSLDRVTVRTRILPEVTPHFFPKSGEHLS